MPLADAVRGLVRKIASAKRPTLQRTGVAHVSSDGQYVLDITKSATVSGHREFAVGDEVDVLSTPKGDLILGHQWQKGDTPTRVPRPIEEVEEIYATSYGPNPYGRSWWLRSWRGLFYLDLDAAVAKVIQDSRYMSNGSRFYRGFTFSVVFGQVDNQFGVHVTWTGGGGPFSVIYVFKIARAEGSDQTPADGTVTVGNAEFGNLKISLLAYYDLSELALDTGISVDSTITLTAKQFVWILHLNWSTVGTVTYYDGGGPGGAAYFHFIYDTTASASMDSLEIALGTSSSVHSYNILVDFDHLYGLSGSQPYYVLAESPKYSLVKLHWWIDQKGRPVLVFRVTNAHRHDFKPWAKMKSGGEGEDNYPVVVWDTTQLSMSATVDFGEPPLLVVRLDQSSGGSGLAASLLARTCEQAISLSREVVKTFSSPWGFSLFGPESGQSNWPFFWTHWNRYKFDDPWVHNDWERWNSDPPGWYGPTSVHSENGGGGQASATASDEFSQSGALRTTMSPFIFGRLYDQSRDYTLTAEVTFPYKAHHEWKNTIQNIKFDEILIMATLTASYSATQTTNSSNEEPPNNLAVIDARSHRGTEDAGDVLAVSRLAPPFGSQDERTVRTGLWSFAPDGDSAAMLREISGDDGYNDFDFNYPSNSLNKNFALLEYPLPTAPRQIAALDGSILATLPDELGTGLVGETPVVVLAPDRLYDCRETVLKFRSPTNLDAVLSKPKPLASIAALSALNIQWGDTGKRTVHTVGRRTKQSG